MGKDKVNITGGSLALIADKLAQQLYGKSLLDCLGKAQNLPSKPRYGGGRITINVPDGKWVRPVKHSSKCTKPEHYAWCITSMHNHALQHGIACVLCLKLSKA